MACMSHGFVASMPPLYALLASTGDFILWLSVGPRPGDFSVLYPGPGCGVIQWLARGITGHGLSGFMQAFQGQLTLT